MTLEIEDDPKKDITNRDKHGMSLAGRAGQVTRYATVAALMGGLAADGHAPAFPKPRRRMPPKQST